MAGSRKGERRGGRKPGVEPKPRPPKVKKGAKEPTPREKHYNKNRNAPKRTEEYYREITAAMTLQDARQIEPREVMLEAMRYFHSRAMNERRMKEQLVASLPNLPDDSPQWPVLNELLEQTEGRIERMHVLAADMGFKVAPYMHAKLATVELTGKDGAPLNIIQSLMVEISQGGDSSWLSEVEGGPVIEHQPPHIGEEA